MVAEIYFNQNLTPGKIKEYMKFLKSKFGADTCRTTFNYIIVVLGKYLLMTVSWSIHKGNLDGVEEEFSKFNENFYQLVQDFSIVTGEEFLSGFEDEQEQSNSLKGTDNYSCEVQKLATQLQQLKTTRNQDLWSCFYDRRIVNLYIYRTSLQQNGVPSGPFLVSRAGTVG